MLEGLLGHIVQVVADAIQAANELTAQAPELDALVRWVQTLLPPGSRELAAPTVVFVLGVAAVWPMSIVGEILYYIFVAIPALQLDAERKTLHRRPESDNTGSTAA